MSKSTIEKILKFDIGLILAADVLWVLNLYKLEVEFDLANNILIYGLFACSFLAIFYILVGCNKQYGAGLFKLFLIVFAVVELSTLINHQYQPTVSIMMVAIRFACLILLSQANDLGEKKSKWISIILIVTSIVDILALANLGMLSYAWQGLPCELSLEITVLCLVVAKYIDKKERGSK